jgi:hypothetical protein
MHGFFSNLTVKTETLSLIREKREAGVLRIRRQTLFY